MDQTEAAGDDGGPAFPIAGMEHVMAPYAGMSLRDWFAGQAIGPLIASGTDPGWKQVSDPVSVVASSAYKIADAMLKYRSAPSTTPDHSSKDSA